MKDVFLGFLSPKNQNCAIIVHINQSVLYGVKNHEL